MKTLLLVAAGLCVGANSAWAVDVASHNFNSSTTPFTIVDDARLGVTYGEHVQGAGDYYAKYACTRNSGKAFALYNFSSSVTDAATVNVEFDCYFKSGSWQSFISLADADHHTADVLGIGNVNYNGTGAIFNLGQNRAKVAGQNENHFGVNSTHVSTLDETCLDTWIHVNVSVDNANKKVSYTIKNADQSSTLKEESNIDFLNTTAQRCSQIDIYLGNNTDNFVYIDNLVITKTISSTPHNYSINAVAGGTTIKENVITGEANEGAQYAVSGLPYVIEKDSKFYVLSDANVKDFATTFFMGNADQVKEINYTLDESIIYFKEAEDINSSQKSAGNYSGGFTCGYYANPVTVTISSTGVYQLQTNVTGRDSNSSLEVYTPEGTTSVAKIPKNSGLGIKTANFLATGNMRVGGPYYSDKFQNSKGVDYVLVRKLYDVTDASKVIGAVDYTTGYMADATESFTLAQGKKVTYTFRNHGKNAANYNNWALEMSGKYNGNDFVYGWAGGSHVNTWGEANANTNSVTTDGTSMDWTTHNAEMMDCPVTVTVNYYNNGIFALKSEAKSASHTYNTWFAYNNAQSGNIGLRLGVDASWLEVQDIVTDDATVDVTIGSAGWATLYTPTAVSFEGSGLTAYTATLEGSTVNLTPVTTVPANTGVVLKGSAKTYNLTEIASSSTEQGDLQGSIAGATFFDENTNRYVLALNDNNEVQFTKLGSGFVTAGKAFLVVAGGSVQAKSLNVMFAADPTGISNVNAAEATLPVKRIVNGQLVIEKNGKSYNAAGAEF